MKKNTAESTTSVAATTSTVNAPETINQHCVDAIVCITLKGDKTTVENFKQQLKNREEVALATIQANWDNGKVDRNGLPIGSAPNDLYNSIAEVERALLQMVSDPERVKIATATVRTLVAGTCSTISQFKSKLAGKTSGKVKNTASLDQSYL